MWRSTTSSSSAAAAAAVSNIDQAVSIICDGPITSTRLSTPAAQEQSPRNNTAAAGSSVYFEMDKSNHTMDKSNHSASGFFRRSSASGNSNRRQRRRSSRVDAFQTCSVAHLLSYIDAGTMPFVAQSPLPTSAIVATGELKTTSKTIGQGDYTKTTEVKGFKFSRSRLAAGNPIHVGRDEGPDDLPKTFALKTLHPQIHEDANPEVAFDTASRRLIREILYLAALSSTPTTCPFLLKFRGFWMSERSPSFELQKLDACHLITDRMGETLEERIKTWKYHRQRRQQENSTQKKFILESVQMDLCGPVSSSLMMHKLSAKPQDPTQQYANSSHHRMKLQLKREEYPDDLVALQTNYVLQIAHALEFLHERGIVGRDLRLNTIGFKEFPHHHTIVLFHFGSCREVPRTTEHALIPAEPIPAQPGGHLSISRTVHHEEDRGEAMANDASHIRRTFSREVARSPRSEAKHYRAPESYPTVPAPKQRKQQMMDDSLHQVHTGGTTVTRSHTNITCTTTTLIRDNHTTVGYQYEGYNCRADVYSLMMIYYELLTDSKPFGRNIITREGHFYRVQTHGLRPSLNKLHFPRTIKAVLEAGWNPDLQERSTAKQIRQRLTTILPMLEGKGLPLALQQTNTTTVGVGKARVLENVGVSLPARAASLLNPQGTGNGWSSVWSRGSGNTNKKLDTKQVMDTLKAHRVGQDKKKKKPGDDKQPKLKVPKGMSKSKSYYKDWLPAFKSSVVGTGMVKSQSNDRTAKILLGDSYDKSKRHHQSSGALKKAYY